ncbi:GNAT family N-acetyltransferase [Flavobacteriaceae bacterium]|nr:GNAT family N-acetyltransferase [Flavobacteriaceae bacterium]MDB2427525.1 GNAT family N-acetyltransferase [Flavobacteriaceae bacterium]MDB2684677.1 GNAT family N-acetyltransferase [Flavobacteriaceae bacterium]MDB4256677.1 GNAT family N-acetyltransferase [Flavobacteriaceae bacterium]MDC0331135.1 GNAT family N-acetyltransferase [Flavobacteriaceae bacterium]
MIRNQITSIKKATINDLNLLASLSVEAFLPAHGHSSPEKDIKTYLEANFSIHNFKKEIANPAFKYYLIYHHNKIAGFSKIIFNTPSIHITENTITKMERLYLLEEFYGLHLGTQLMNFNSELTKKNNQQGIWIEVWIENYRAIKFYKKMGFTIVGEANFRVSETHSNPNYIMYLDHETYSNE